jgi:hypothetical protein
MNIFSGKEYFRVVFSLFIACFCGLNACAFVVENPKKPDQDGTTAKRSSSSDPDGSGKQTAAEMPDNAIQTLPFEESFIRKAASEVSVPPVQCGLNISRGIANSSGKSGAALTLVASGETNRRVLILRNTSTNTLADATKLTFESGNFTPGLKEFEYHREDGRSCKLSLNLEENDVSQKILLSLTVSIPN